MQPRAQALWISLGLIAANLVVYAPLGRHDFLNFDDPQYVSENPQVSRGLSWRGVSWALTARHAGNWHPLTWLSHMLDVQAYGINAGPHHFTNVLLHIANTLLLFGLFHRMTRALGRSAFVAALFAVHPLHVESVAWLAERKDVLSTLLWMLTVWAYLAYVRQPRLGRYSVLLVLFALGLMAKPMLVTLPFVLLLLDYWPLCRVTQRSAWRRLIIEKLPLLALAIASSIVTLAVQHAGGAIKGLDVLPLDRRLANALVTYVVYIGKMLWPTRLAVVYPYPRSLPPWLVFWALVGLVTVSIAVIRAVRRRPYLLVGWLWYLGTLLPVIGLVQVGSQPMADRYTYVPLIGLFVIVAWGIPDLLPRWRYQSLALKAAAMLMIAGCMMAAGGQVRHWKDSIALWEHALEVTTENYRAESNLGHALAKQGRLSDSIAHYVQALRLKPDFAEAHNNFGHALARQGRGDEALAHYSEALRLEPDYVEAHTNLGVAQTGLGKTDEAIRHFSEALRIEPDLAVAHNNLGAALAKQGRIDEATRHFSEALRINPDYPDAHKNLGLALAAQGRTAEAMVQYTEALRLRPDAEAHNALGNCLVARGRVGEAVTQYSEALRLQPDFAEAHNGLGAALADLGRVDEAIAQYSEALRINPDFAEAHSNLGTALAGQGNVEEALREFLEALRIKPDDADFSYDVGVMFARKGRAGEAVRHFQTTLQLNPTHEGAQRALHALTGRGRGSRTKPRER